MGRRNVALELMRSGASLKVKTHQGMGPLELCNDGWLRDAITGFGAHSGRNGPGTEWQVCQNLDGLENCAGSSTLQFEPFFVPRAPVMQDIAHSKGLQRIGVEIFNQRPGQGLAFLVATSTVRDFPTELSAFLREHYINRAQVGEFLGEDFSMAQTLRLEFIDSVSLIGTGVVSCLAKVFKQLQIPKDMQKIDRLIKGVAQIWWRQHERLNDFHRARDHVSWDAGSEVEGMCLMQRVSGHSMLHQLMFSTVLLHWSLYAPLPPTQRVTLPQWLEMNSGLGGGEECEEHMQRLIYDTISRRFLPQLQVWGAPAQSPSCPVRGGPLLCSRSIENPPPALPEGELAEETQIPLPTVRDEYAFEGWARLLGGGFPAPAAASGSPITYRHLRSIHSEATFMARSLVSPVNSRPGPQDVGCNLLLGSQLLVGTEDAHTFLAHQPPASPNATLISGHRRFGGLGGGGGSMSLGGGGGGVSLGGGGGAGHHEANSQDHVWLTLRCGLLLFAPKPKSWAPYAFTDLGDAVIKSVAREKLTFTLAPRKKTNQDDTSDSGAVSGGASAVGSGDPASHSEPISPQLQLVFLLPDGRWQVIELPRLEVQVVDSEQLERWTARLRKQMQCGGFDLDAAAKTAV